ncbi:PIK3R4 kinase-related protein (incomplete catalytic triad), partial [Cardiosporidium cionae]
MGNGVLSVPLTNSSNGSEDVGSLLLDYPDITSSRLMHSNRLFKVVQGTTDMKGPILVKLFIRRDSFSLDQYRDDISLSKAALSFELQPNVCTYERVDYKEKSACLIRHYFSSSLFDRLHGRPFLSSIQLKWIAFQLIAGVCQLHSLCIPHGDLKTENVMLTSWLQAFLVDMTSFKPVYLPDWDTQAFTFFFESENRRKCYLAPERFYSGGLPQTNTKTTHHRFSMDIFSMGCTLAELFLEGVDVLDLPQVLKMRSLETERLPAELESLLKRI